jgi:hypothetical protein
LYESFCYRNEQNEVIEWLRLALDTICQLEGKVGQITQDDEAEQMV